MLSFIADANRGELLLVFNEVMITQSLDPSDISILNTQDVGSVQLQVTEVSEISAVRSGNLTSLVVELTRSDLNILQSNNNIFTGTSNTFLSLASTTQLSDVSGNIISTRTLIQALDFILDITPPELSSFLEFNMNNGSFALSFNEPIDRDRIDLTRATKWWA